MSPMSPRGPAARPRRVVAFTPGRNVPSRRFRVAQLVPHLAGHGLQVEERVARWGAYPPHARWARPFWLGATLADRVPQVVASRGADVILLQREFVSTLATLEGLTGRPRLLDVDDAIWLHRGGAAARRLAAWCDGIICGNAYLAEHFARWNPAVDVIPTGVDVDRFAPAPAGGEAAGPVIGWSGTSAAFPHLYAIAPALRRVLAEVSDARLLVVADAPPAIPGLDPARVDYVRWHPDVEVAALRRMRVGIMPLPDDEWARGKCSYKMLLYMACAVAVVVSPVGMNADVLRQGDVGAAARTHDEWVDALVGLVRDGAVARRQGEAGRAVVLEHYAVPRVAAALAARLNAA